MWNALASRLDARAGTNSGSTTATASAITAIRGPDTASAAVGRASPARGITRPQPRTSSRASIDSNSRKPTAVAANQHPRHGMAPHRARDGEHDEQRHPGQRGAPADHRDEIDEGGEQTAHGRQHESERVRRRHRGDAVGGGVMHLIEQV